MIIYESTAGLEPRVGYAAGWIGVVESEGRIVERKVSLGEAGRASQFAAFFANFWKYLKWTFWNTKQTIHTIRTHCLWKNIIESVHQYIICRSQGSPQWCCPSHGCTIGFKECRPSIGCRRGRTRLCHFCFRSVLFHVLYSIWADQMDWIQQGAWRIHTFWYPCQHALNSFQLFFWKPLPIFSNRKGNKVPHAIARARFLSNGFGFNGGYAPCSSLKFFQYFQWFHNDAE